MLDENLPSFQFRPSSDNPDAAVLFFTQNGSEPEPEYVFKRADPISQPECRGNYAAAIVDPHQPGVVYGEVLVAPEWTQPTLSAAEIRAQNGAAAGPSSPAVPDAFSVQLYNPDQSVVFKMFGSSGWGKSGGWEFEIPSRSFRMPSASQLDRQQADATVTSDIAPKVMFKWKRDGRLSKDMTCYMSGRSLGRHKSKEPDITIAFLKQGRDPALTIYEPNMRRVDVEDRKGLDLVLLLGAAVIRDLYLVPRQDPFNMMTETGGRLRKNSRPPVPLAASTNGGGPVMSGAIANNSTTTTPAAMSSAPPSSRPPTGPATQAEIDAETARLKAMVEQEEREADERARREVEEQRRIKEMLEQEEQRERQRREAEIAAETERLRQMYGTEGQDLPSARPNLPPRPADPRPGSAGPSSSAQPSLSSWWRGGGTPQQPGAQSSGQGGAGGGGGSSSSVANRLSTNPYVNNAAASVSGFFNRERDRRGEEGKKVRKKRSVHF
ncbi:hypothetical protein MCOR27_011543 [Pyricularia oryzae]|uniref:Uncharacterized protein n=5 Tax=Pyricularia TaxID=48558 RepID=A0ABQ8N5X4_PYRGI|nr:uncharacterized protein MGG_15138 [Pyricularia oryzae 70-15]ELQ39058.1 hypothetical protein OOU_Y34scaffold00516g93 [Pyricularia oryzae Y34]KAH8848124.1 hypothetical protein MCOR01_001514 [Pyricularia oryzae]KAI6290483.1 hypothetical protein MCOR33_011268 [Pyricularia grisea]EHA52937.1 hypothetical protein MGG_15138 [Pyricularia oryzae 70-15]KAI6252128.1 hypothetical protein MCOR19_011252 [Pyricularia oryzae]